MDSNFKYIQPYTPYKPLMCGGMPENIYDPYGWHTTPRKNREPIWLSAQRYTTFIQPRSGGALGSSLFAGWPQYPKAY